MKNMEDGKKNENIEKMHKIAMRMVKKSAILFILWLLAKKEMCGYDIIKTLSAETMIKVSPKPAMIYPLLNKLCKRMLLSCKIKKDGRRIKKYYKTTAKGLTYMEIAKNEYKKNLLLREFIMEMIK